MIRRTILIAALLAAGCGEAEQSRFTPASADPKGAGPGEPVKASTEVAIPRNIETH
ncbi:hypothetical protein P12x_000455 [Tundrisphaera lichenicola]|uniref:hypothetical protein n=1 Tax=Tundrisphaera lichenicola TaxID=2029860 RepID=UPI003EBD86E5